MFAPSSSWSFGSTSSNSITLETK
uniref:Uncharacterized protein n=1 Tax=Anguilla anguilla TaxID=7936 RepID=A0A0E9ULB7_ANGAN